MREAGQGLKPLHMLAVALAVLLVGVVSHFYDGAPPELTFIKLLSVPMLAAAIDGLDRRYDFDLAYRRWSPAMVERIAATSLVSAAGVTILLAGAESPILGLIWTFVALLVVCAFISAIARRPAQPDI